MPLKRLIITSLWVLFMSTHSLASVESSDSKYAQNIRSVRAAYWPASDDLSPSSIDTKYFPNRFCLNPMNIWVSKCPCPTV